MDERALRQRYPHAAQAYATRVLARLRPDELAALERFAARAFDDPAAYPVGGAERGAVHRVERLIAGDAARDGRGGG